MQSADTEKSMEEEVWRLADRKSPGSIRAFTLIEMLAATAVLIVILGVTFSITQQISRAWTNSSSKIETFQQTRAAFDVINRQIGQATLQTYYDYYDSGGNRRTAANSSTFQPAYYGRYSDLHFVSGRALVTNQISHALFFQSPVGYSDNSMYKGMDTLLNACGFYITYDKDHSRPAFLNDGTLPNPPADHYRFRLMQFLQPDQSLQVYASSTGTSWFTGPMTSGAPPVRILAENVVALVFLPKLAKGEDETATALTDDFEYNTRYAKATFPQQLSDSQLPPVVEVIMVAIDEPSALRICTGPTAPDFGLPGGVNSLFKDVSLLDADLKKLADAFNAKRISYRIFRSQVALRGAKWSS